MAFACSQSLLHGCWESRQTSLRGYDVLDRFAHFAHHSAQLSHIAMNITHVVLYVLRSILKPSGCCSVMQGLSGFVFRMLLFLDHWTTRFKHDNSTPAHLPDNILTLVRS